MAKVGEIMANVNIDKQKKKIVPTNFNSANHHKQPKNVRNNIILSNPFIYSFMCSFFSRLIRSSFCRSSSSVGGCTLRGGFWYCRRLLNIFISFSNHQQVRKFFVYSLQVSNDILIVTTPSILSPNRLICRFIMTIGVCHIVISQFFLDCIIHFPYLTSTRVLGFVIKLSTEVWYKGFDVNQPLFVVLFHLIDKDILLLEVVHKSMLFVSCKSTKKIWDIKD